MELQTASQRRALRKRKAEEKPENNERLSKRLSLLNLEQSGAKLYVPVESQHNQHHQPPSHHPNPLSNGYRRSTAGDCQSDSDGASMMALDDTKYKVYIRNLDDELSSESEAEDSDNLVFLPDIEKHLRENRIPAAVLVRPDPEQLGKQLVLYSVPSSLSVPEEQDSVRKAIIEARARLRRNQAVGVPDEAAMMTDDSVSGIPNAMVPPVPPPEEDPDAMELD